MVTRFVVTLLSFFVALPASAKIEVFLKDYAEVASHQVRLADVATLQATPSFSAAKGLENVLVATITHINQARHIDAKLVGRMIARQQPALARDIQMRGANGITVVLAGETISGERLLYAATSFIKGELSTNPYPFAIRSAALSEPFITVPKGDVQLHPRLLGSKLPMPSVRVAVEIMSDNRKIGSVIATMDIDMTVPAYRLTRTLTAGAILGPGDYEETMQPLQNLKRERFVADAKMHTTDYRLRRTVESGNLLYQEDIETIPYVTRHQKVLAQLTDHGIMIEKTVVAQTDGQLGDIIKVMDAQSQASFAAKVIAQGRVEVK